MARDARGRFLPGPDESRHELTAEERARGFQGLLKAALPSRVKASIRKRIRGFYAGRGQGSRNNAEAAENRRKLDDLRAQSREHLTSEDIPF